MIIEVYEGVKVPPVLTISSILDVDLESQLAEIFDRSDYTDKDVVYELVHVNGSCMYIQFEADSISVGFEVEVLPEGGLNGS